MDEGEEEGNVESLMPNCFSMLLDVYNPGTTTLDLQHIRRLLSEETCAEFLDKGKTNKSDITDKQTDMFSPAFEKMTCLNSGENPSPKGKFSCKENVPLGDALKQKRAVTRREGTGRTTIHRPFKVDLKSFDSLVNEHMPKDQRILQEIHAFWEAEENREVSETIRHKLQEPAWDSETCSRKATSGHIKSGRRARIRRDGTGRQTASRAFDVQFPQYIDSVASSDAEKLEEEEEERPASSHLFINSENQRNNDPNTDLNPSTPGLSIVEMSLMQIKQKELLVPLSSSADKPQREIVEDQETPVYYETKLTLPLQGSIGNVTVRVAPMTSPTPPANPLAAFCVGAMETVKDIGKRFLDFDQILELSSDLNGNTIDTNTFIEQSDIGSVFPEKTSEIREVAICNDKPLDEAPLGISSLEVETRHPEVEFDNYNASGTGGEDARTCTSNNSKMPTIEGHNLLSTSEQGTTVEVPFHKASNTFEIPLDQSLKTSKPKNRCNLVREKYKTRRNSLSGSGTRWDGGVRRSTRIKSRPLEYWRGEKFLYGRVHESLTTVIGIKYSSPPQFFEKRGYKPPAFKVKSFVSEEYADYVQFAAI